jgi:hypothetical protein
VPLPDNHHPENRGVDWPGVFRILLVQVLVLLALSAALVHYVNWSSDAAWAEFSAATKSSAPVAKPDPRPSTPLQAVKGRAPCGPKA